MRVFFLSSDLLRFSPPPPPISDDAFPPNALSLAPPPFPFVSYPLPPVSGHFFEDDASTNLVFSSCSSLCCSGCFLCSSTRASCCRCSSSLLICSNLLSSSATSLLNSSASRLLSSSFILGLSRGLHRLHCKSVIEFQFKMFSPSINEIRIFSFLHLNGVDIFIVLIIDYKL